MILNGENAKETSPLVTKKRSQFKCPLRWEWPFPQKLGHASSDIDVGKENEVETGSQIKSSGSVLLPPQPTLSFASLILADGTRSWSRSKAGNPPW